ncbi:MAG: hypothetical protein WBA07_12180 [Rivularia sp. (in: cyanobacteria)]
MSLRVQRSVTKHSAEAAVHRKGWDYFAQRIMTVNIFVHLLMSDFKSEQNNSIISQ